MPLAVYGNGAIHRISNLVGEQQSRSAARLCCERNELRIEALKIFAKIIIRGHQVRNRIWKPDGTLRNPLRNSLRNT